MIHDIDFSRRLFFDGAMGSVLQQYGPDNGEPSDKQNLLNGKAIVEIHQKYIEAGANVLTANTFGTYSLHYDNVDEIVEAAVSHLKEAIKLSNTDLESNPILMALDMGPTGQLIAPYGDMTFDECYNVFLQTASAGAKAGVDLILIETMMDLTELKAAVQAAKTTNLPVIATMTYDKNGKTMMGTDLKDMAEMLEDLQVNALGMNCGFGPEIYETLLPNLAAVTKLPILVQPNAGLPELKDGKAYYSMTPSAFAGHMAKMSKYAQLLGGCCGTTPDHIKEVIKAVKAI
ncbi:MAG: homocysteine S-methyltransferase family protein [Defluviitaleaceae bacterium]|nr:homocysteine S-methyltransferase family protein [Defluviitaleaceae bacterium]